jgi:subtilase family serine protease
MERATALRRRQNKGDAMFHSRVVGLCVLTLSVCLLAACGSSNPPPEEEMETGQADLIPAKAPGAPFYFSNTEMAPVIHVVNQGDAAAPASTLTVIFTTSGGPVVNEFPVPALGAGEMSAPIIAPLPSGFSSTLVTIRVDGNDVVTESDETNNEDSETLLI